MTRALLAAVLALALALGWSLWRAEVHKGDAEQAATALSATQSELKGVRDVLDTERLYSQRLQAIATRYEGDKNEIERQAAADVAALRDGNLRLRQQWQGCEAGRVPSPGAGPSESDAATADRAEGASDLVRAAAECDAQVRGLQAVILSDRTEN